ncbi:MAG: hypothetical protein GXY85_07725 [Candidatus Brocadiaceae bacterium]|nr:hypothetical protein [Candidatus Brocadiaceae bacterium]
MRQWVVHIRQEGERRPEPAYAVWASDGQASVRAFAPQWEPAAARLEARLKARFKAALALQRPAPRLGRENV